ncbi:MAG: DUF1929 domain-containing protein [Myxococcaceae bacterium]|nr:DUF1929 domain-containing protein [Myxococcaceae bacterium]
MRRSAGEVRGGARALLSLVLFLGTAAGAQPSEVGEWSGVLPWTDTGTHVVLLPTGKVLTWSEFNPESYNLWDPVTGTHTEAPDVGYNAFCSGHTLMADGGVLVAGGHIESNVGLPNASVYDPFTNTWERLPDMNAGRWYPNTTSLPNGEVLVIAGTATGSDVGENRLPQVWQPAMNAWRDLTGAQRTLATYPWMFVAPNGQVFMAGPDPVAGYLDTSGVGRWNLFAKRKVEDREAGSAVMYDDGKVMVCGGGENMPVAAVEVIDLYDAAPAWRAVQPMGQPRKQHNTTLLPDGKVLVTGGSSGAGKSDDGSPVYATELWDPSTETFKVLAPSHRFRGYHSSTLLLPDGRVMHMGGEDAEEVELFSPPYLFNGERPTVSSAPLTVTYGETFTVTTPQAASITKVTWLKPGSPTHAFNQGQRFNRLAFTRKAGALEVTAPANSNLAPPGFYMLFLLDEKGVPSVAHWVKVGGPDMEPPPEVRAMSYGEAWKYDASGEDPGASWLSAGFDDSRWKTGEGGFGTAGDGLHTQLALGEQQATVYFRRKLFVRGAVVGGRLAVKHDGGVAVFINGTSVLAENVTKMDHTAWASAAVAPGTVSSAPIPAGLLVEGENTVAVLVKRARPTTAEPSPELRFDLELVVNTSGQLEPVPLLSLTSPNGGESVAGGATLQVAWSTYGALPQVKLEYSSDRGASWQTMEGAVANTGGYAWSVPGLGSEQVLVRVSGAVAPASADTSDAPFSVGDGPGGPPTDTPAPPPSQCGEPGMDVCAEEPGPGGHRSVACSTSGMGPVALGLLLALGWSRRRRRRDSHRREE